MTSAHKKPGKDVLDRLKDAAGSRGYSEDAADIAPHLVEWRERYRGETPLLLRPATTAAVAAIVTIAAETGTAIVPQGGNTGLVGGQIPFPEDNAVLLSLDRMTTLRDLDATNGTMTVEAGMTLAAAQANADEAGFLFPLSLASEGTCQIGGNLATNAGGNAVLKYGNARELVLGLEVVLADGSIWNGLRGLRKDNTGYDLKQLFIGAEGTLGIITAAVLKLYPRPRDRQTAFAAVRSVEDAVSLLTLAREATGDQVTAFELVPRIGLDFELAHMEGIEDPLTAPSPWYVLIELSSSTAKGLGKVLEDLLAKGAEEGLVTDAAIAASQAQRDSLWRIRENLSEVQKFEGGSIKHDISVPVSAIPAFIARASEAVEKAAAGIRPVPFGHIGDGNVHFNLSQPEGANRDDYLARWEEMGDIVHGIAAEMEGSISAEHGLGRMKVDEITRYKSATEIAMMRAVKRALDPNNILNPGKVVRLD